MDCHATLLEFEKDRGYLLSTGFNTIGIGLAYDKDKLIVVNIYSARLVNVEICSMIEESQTIYLEGKVLHDKYGVFAIRLVEETNQNKTILALNSQDIYFDPNNKRWNCKFKNVSQIFQEIDKEKRLFIQVYLRDQPELIKYGESFTGQIKFNNLILGFRSQLFHFPHPLVIREQEKIDNDDKTNMVKEVQRKKDEDVAEKAERNRRDNKKMKDGSLELVQEEPEDYDESVSEHTKSSLDQTKKINKSKDIRENDDSFDFKGGLDERREPYDEQLVNLEKTLEQLKKENEEIQKNIALIFEFKKHENKEDKKLYKESNINESTYHDTLTTAANLYNDLHTHRTKLNADLSKYDQSIKIQEERKKEVYKILMNYKEELLNNAEDRKGAKIPQKQVEVWLATENQYEEEIRKLRIDNIKSTLKLNRINKELKKTEEYFEGLHYIDFEQLKIENNVSL